MDYTIGFIKINEDEEEYLLDSIIVSNGKDVNMQTTFTKYVFKYYDGEKLKEFSIKITPSIHVI